MEPSYIDIHAHVHFAAFDGDRDEVVDRTRRGKTWMINVGTKRDTSQAALMLAKEKGEGLYATVGLHPIHTGKSFHDTQETGEGGKAFVSRNEEFSYDFYEKLAQDPKVVAIGECGLDYYRLEPHSKETQQAVFIEQIALANALNKPLMLHIRNAYRDAYEILKTHARVLGNVHFFAGTWEEAKLFLDLGSTLSFTGVITFARDYDETVKNAPLERIMCETDCPYVSPVPYRGKRNEPRYVREVVRTIALLRGVEEETVRFATVANARRLFSI